MYSNNGGIIRGSINNKNGAIGLKNTTDVQADRQTVGLIPPDRYDANAKPAYAIITESYLKGSQIVTVPS